SPRKFHHHAGLDRDAVTDPGAEQSEKRHSPARSRPKGREQQRLHKKPNRLKPSWPAALETFRSIQVETHFSRLPLLESINADGILGRALRIVDAGKHIFRPWGALEQRPIDTTQDVAAA